MSNEDAVLHGWICITKEEKALIYDSSFGSNFPVFISKTEAEIEASENGWEVIDVNITRVRK